MCSQVHENDLGKPSKILLEVPKILNWFYSLAVSEALTIDPSHFGVIAQQSVFIKLFFYPGH